MAPYANIVENRGITMLPLFLRLISWKGPPHPIKNFVKLDFFTYVLVVLFVSDTEEKCYFCFDGGKVWILNWVGRTFSWYQSQKQWCHCNSLVFYYMWLSLWFFQKMNKLIWLYYYDMSGWLVFICFLEKSKTPKKPFRN